MKKEILLPLLIFFLALFLRLNNINWDVNLHLHPDERFLTMVGNAMRMPANIGMYLNPSASQFNPANIQFPFFVYGVFPLVFNKIIAILLNNDTYNLFTIQGRAMNAVADGIIIFIVYAIVRIWDREKKKGISTACWAAFFYAVSVLPIQLSHYFTTDTFLSLFSVSAFLFFLLFSRSGKIIWLIVGVVTFGLAVSSKINAFFMLPLLGYFSLRYLISRKPTFHFVIFLSIISTIILYSTVRLASPYYFQSVNIFDPTISKLFIENIKSLKSFEGNDVWYPPAIQWLSKGTLFTIKNIIFYGIGFLQSTLIIAGIVSIFKRKKQIDLYMVLFWLGVIIVYQSFQFVQTMRYLIFIYPFLAIITAMGASFVIDRFSKHRLLKSIVVRSLFIGALIWPLAFISIYFTSQTRLTASEWVYKNVPPNSTILGEYWDDALPVSIGNLSSQTYTIVQMKVFDVDTNTKWNELQTQLKTGDYYILSSNRAWGSIMPLTEKYPKMSRFYRDLFAGNTPYKKVAEFNSYPSLKYLGIPLDLPDEGAEEAFSVYDHPKVLIYKNIKPVK